MTVAAAPAGAAVRPSVPLSTRVGWGLGGIADNFMVSTLFSLGMIIYVTAFDMRAGLAGVALSIPRFADAITDPLVGNYSDNFRSRFGRRRPLMAIGVVGTAVLLPLFWFPPFPETAQAPWHSNGPFWWMAVLGSLYFLFYTLFMVPYSALGFELTDDYDERTRVLAWRMYLGLLASMAVPSLYWLCRLDRWGGEVAGARWVSAGISLVILVTGLAPVLACRERAGVAAQASIRIGPAVAYTLNNRAFVILLLGYLAVVMGLFTAGTIGQFALIYYVFQDAAGVDAAKDNAALLGLIAGVLAALTSYLSMYLSARLSRLTGKKAGMLLGLAFMLAGTLSIWFLYDPSLAINDPAFGPNEALAGWLSTGGSQVDPAVFKWGVLLAVFVGALGGQGCWLMIDSMTADVCDEDEFVSGRRREGMFGAVQGFARKMAFAVTVLAGGFLLDWAGFDAAAAEAAGGVPEAVNTRMLLVLIACQGGGLVLAIVGFLFFPITRARAQATAARLRTPPPARVSTLLMG